MAFNEVRECCKGCVDLSEQECGNKDNIVSDEELQVCNASLADAPNTRIGDQQRIDKNPTDKH